jgi:DNA polymerase III alpha subunit
MKTIPIFRSSSGSTSKSILTPNPAEKEIRENQQVSIPTIAQVHNLETTLVIDEDFTAFQDLYKNLNAIKKQFYFGVSLIVCNDMSDKSQESLLTEHKVNILMKNSEGYNDLIQLFNKASIEGFYYRPRIDSENLKKYWTDNLKLCVPFFDSFLYNNSLVQGSNVVPDFGKIKPIFFVENHALPFNEQMKVRVEEYCRKGKFEIQKTHSCYYYSQKHAEHLMVLKCIRKRSHMEKPNLDAFSTRDFSFESFLESNL